MAVAYLFFSCNFILVNELVYSIDGDTMNQLPQSVKNIHSLLSLFKLAIMENS